MDFENFINGTKTWGKILIALTFWSVMGALGVVFAGPVLYADHKGWIKG